MMNPSDIASRNLQHYTNTNSSDEWEQQLIGEHNNDNSTHLPFAFQAQSFNNTQGLLETLDEAVPTVVPTSFPTSTTPGNHFQPQIQPTPQLPSQMYLEAVPANNQRRSSSTNPSAQLNLYLTTSNHKHQRRSSTHSSPKPKRTRKNRPGKRFGAKKRSWVWPWFKQDARNPNIAVCNSCMRAIVRVPSDKGSPKKLVEHLRTHGITAGSRKSPAGKRANRDHNQQYSGDRLTGQDNTSYTDQPYNFERQAPPIGRTDNFDNALAGQHIPPLRSNQSRIRLFQHHLLSFLIVNRLPINVIRSREFYQVVQDLRSEAVPELQEVLYLYDSIIQVSQFGPDTQAFATTEENATMALLAGFLQR